MDHDHVNVRIRRAFPSVVNLTRQSEVTYRPWGGCTRQLGKTPTMSRETRKAPREHANLEERASVTEATTRRNQLQN